jgi:nitrile hydratase accessory protein
MRKNSVHSELEAELRGRAAVPRRNGELAFEQPWHGRAFGLAVGLHDAGLFRWDEFRPRLIARIAAWDRSHDPNEPYVYYEHWLRALEDLLIELDVLDPEDAERRSAAVAKARAHEHGHEHDPEEGEV